MGRRFAELAFTPLVKKQQEVHGSRRQYERVERADEPGDRLGPYERALIQGRDGFYMASVSETGWPYLQYRGGPKGFLRVIDDQTLGFVDLRGNKQYVSVGNLQHDNRVALFLMDYPGQRRLKILGRSKVYEGDAAAQKLIEQLRAPEEKTPAERALLITIEAFDWNKLRLRSTSVLRSIRNRFRETKHLGIFVAYSPGVGCRQRTMRSSPQCWML
jgi:predicted pyridoxine 5'-phosphate oxidase superfamily flavin-nucleotide-binding protein